MRFLEAESVTVTVRLKDGTEKTVHLVHDAYPLEVELDCQREAVETPWSSARPWREFEPGPARWDIRVSGTGADSVVPTL